MLRTRVPMVVWQAMLGVVFLAAWEAASRSGGLDPFFFSRPSDVLLRLWGWMTRGTIWLHLLTTFIEATLSFAIGASSGVVAGFVLARAPFFSALFDPYI